MKKWFYELPHFIKNYILRLPFKIAENIADTFILIKNFIKNFSITRYRNEFVKFLKRPLLPFILYKMLLKSFLYWFSIAQGLFIIILLIFDFFTKINDYLNASTSVFNMLYITFLFTPRAMWLTMPVAIMFGITMSISYYYQNNELIAIFSSGISIHKFVVPIILFNIILSLFMIFIDSYIVIPTYRYRDNLYEHVTKKRESNEKDITVKGENDYFWNVENFVANKNMLQKIIVIKLNEDFRVTFRIDASSAVYTKEGWLFNSGTLRLWDNTGDLVEEKKFHKKIFAGLVEKPSTFKNIFKKSDYDIEKMTIIEAKKRIKLLKKLNIAHDKESLEYYKKFSFPFTLVIVCLFAIGVSTISQKNIIILSLFFSIGLAILYYIMQMLILDVLSASGKINPFIGAWLSILIFLPISIVLVKNAKT